VGGTPTENKSEPEKKGGFNLFGFKLRRVPSLSRDQGLTTPE
jgi:hypothetical protein